MISVLSVNRLRRSNDSRRSRPMEAGWSSSNKCAVFSVYYYYYSYKQTYFRYENENKNHDFIKYE